MLMQLRIENFALIDRLDITFEAGLNVLTGETGAGKSIVLDAIDAVLGGKVGRSAIRTSCERAWIEAMFVPPEQLSNWLQDQGIDRLDDGVIACSREIVATESQVRSRLRVNGMLVNRQLVGQLRDHLVEITAQGQTMNLLSPQVQRDLLDAYGGKKVLPQREQVAQAYRALQTATQALQDSQQTEQTRLQRLDMIHFQLKDLQEAQLTEADELEQLEQERERLGHVVELQQLSYHAYQLLYQSDRDTLAVADLLGDAEGKLMAMVEYDKSLTPLLEMVQGALNQVVEAGQQVNLYGDNLEADPERLDIVEARIRLLKQVLRKYGPTLTEAIALQETLQLELAQLTEQEQSLEILTQNLQAAQLALGQQCQILRQSREQAAAKLEKQLVKALKPLAMEKVIFRVELTAAEPNAYGSDRITFLFSPNPGEPLQPLAETASGGEMSRFLLALKACFAQSGATSSTLIFDEIDVGVSGKVAQAIAEKLYQLAQPHQVLCVTHQPLVAAMADAHFHVSKQAIKVNVNSRKKDVRTVVRITPLDQPELRRDELAQLTGGHSAEEAIAFAESLLAKAEIARSSLGKVSSQSRQGK